MSDQNSELRQRRDELVRCKDIIGWSWLTVGSRLGLNSTQSFALKNCKRPILDSDLRWMQSLATAVEALPRPLSAGTEDYMRVSGSIAMTSPADAERPAPAALPSAQEPSSGRVASVLADLYVGADLLNSEDKIEGCRWAVGEAASLLGITEDVVAAIKARGRQQAPAPASAPAPEPLAAAYWPPAAIGQRVPL